MWIKTGRYCIVLLLLMAFSSRAADTAVRITAAVDRDTVYLLEQVIFQVSVESGGRGLPEPEFNPGEGFKVIGRPATSTEFQMINGAVSNKVTYTYQLQAVKEGKWVISPVNVSAQGQTYHSNPVTVQVIKLSAQSTGSQGSDSNADGVVDGIPKDRLTDLFIWATVDLPDPYVGQGVNVKYELYTRLNVRNFDIREPPQFSGFWMEELPVPKPPAVVQKKVGGMDYATAKIYEVNVYPTVSGELMLDPLTSVIEVQVRGRDPFDDFFGGPFGSRMGSPFSANQQEVRSSQSLSIHVKSLPEEGKPPEFSGAVGKYEIEASLSKNTVQETEGITLHLKLSGNQSLKMIAPPAISQIPDFKVFDPKSEEEQFDSGKPNFRSKLFDYVLVPYKSGEHTIPEVSFAFFDPESNQYSIIKTSPLSLHVDPAPGGASKTQIVVKNQSEIKLLSQDFRYIKMTRINPYEKIYHHPVFMVLLMIPPVLIPVFLAVGRHRHRLTGDLAYARSFKARSGSVRRFKKATELLKSGHPGKTLDEIAQAFSQYLGDRLNLPAAGLTFNVCEEQLKQNGVNDQMISRCRTFWSTLETARFAPIQPDEKDIQLWIREGQQLIDQLDNLKLKSRGVTPGVGERS